jgi:hypothetical protein
LSVPFDLFVRDADRHSLFHVGTIQNQSTIQIPCLLKSKNLFLYAESRSRNLSLEAQIHVHNPNNEGILSPSPYSSLLVQDGAVHFAINFSLHSDFLTTDSAAQYAIVGLYDLDRDVEVKRQSVPLANLSSVGFPIQEEINRGILYLIPGWHTYTTGCSTLIQPLFVRKKETEEPPEFTVPLGKSCVLPPGVNDQDYQVPNEKLRFGLSLGILSLCVVVCTIIPIWHYTCRTNPFPLWKTTVGSAALLT